MTLSDLSLKVIFLYLGLVLSKLVYQRVFYQEMPCLVWKRIGESFRANF